LTFLQITGILLTVYFILTQQGSTIEDIFFSYKSTFKQK